MWMSLPWLVCLFMDYIQCGWLSIQLGGCGRAHLGLYACSSTTFSVGGSQYNWVCGRALAYHLGHSYASWCTIIESNIRLMVTMWMVCSHDMVGHTCTSSSRNAMLPQYYYCWHNYTVPEEPMLSVGLWNLQRLLSDQLCCLVLDRNGCKRQFLCFCTVAALTWAVWKSESDLLCVEQADRSGQWTGRCTKWAAQ